MIKPYNKKELKLRYLELKNLQQNEIEEWELVELQALKEFFKTSVGSAIKSSPRFHIL